MSHRLSFEELLKNEIIPSEKLMHYPATRAYLEILNLQDQMSYRAFFDQLHEVINQIKKNLIETDEENALENQWYRFQLLKKMLNDESFSILLQLISIKITSKYQPPQK